MELKAILKGIIAQPELWSKGGEDARLSVQNTPLQDANLQGTNLSEVTELTQKQVDMAITNADTILPAGLRRA